MDANWTFGNAIFGSFSPTTLAVAIATLLVAVAYYIFKNSGLPPGPMGVPFLGFWPFLDLKNLTHQFEKLKKRYGDVFSYTCTGTLYINLGSSKAVREAIITKSDCFAKRSEVFNYMTDVFKAGNVIFHIVE